MQAQMSKQRVLSNFLIMGCGQVVTWLLSTVYLAVVSRYLGPVRQGELSLALAIVAVLALAIGLGMDTLITRTVARAPERASSLVSAAILVRLALSIPGLIVLYVYTEMAHLNAETRGVAVVLAVGMVIGACGNTLVAAFQGRERMAPGVVVAVVQNALGLGVAILIAWQRAGVIYFAVANIIIDGLLLALNLYWIRHVARLTLRVPLRVIREVVAGSLAFWASSIFLTIYIYVDSIILQAVAGTQAVGIYAPATRMFAVTLFLPAIIGAVTLPLLSRLGVDAGADFDRVSRKTLSLLIACAVPITIGLATFSRPLILTVFGNAFSPSVPVLVVLSLCIPFMFLNIQFNQMLTARDRQKVWTIIMAASCVLNPVANLILIPLAEQRWHNGAQGAALALLSTEIFMTVYGMWVLRTALRDRGLARVALGALAAGGAQGAALLLMGASWPPLAETVGVITYGGVALALGVLPRQDMALLYETTVGPARRIFMPRIDAHAGPLEQIPPKV